MSTLSVTISRSKSGLPTIQETKGGQTNTGLARVLCDASGRPLRALFTPRSTRAGGDGAVFVVADGMHLVTAYRQRGSFAVGVWRFVALRSETVTKSRYDRGPNDDPRMPIDLRTAVTVKYSETTEYADFEEVTDTTPFAVAIEAAKRSAACYHCRCGTHYAA